MERNRYSWAVVTFVGEGKSDEESTSEIPSSWLVNETKCYWPTTKNISALMSKEVAPDPNSAKWAIYDIRVEFYCDTLKHARKKAVSVSSSSDEMSNPKGRGLRTKKKSLKAVQEASDQFDSSSSSEEQNIDFSTLPQCPTEFLNEEFANNSVVESQTESFVITDDPINVESIPIDIIDTPLVTPEILGDIKSFIGEKLEAVDRSMREVNLNLTDFNRRLERIEQNINRSKITYNTEEVREMVNLLPLKSREDVEALEGLLSTNQNYKNLIKYLTNIGGANTKENIIRILKKVFTNGHAVQCSWLGQRNNFKVANLKIMECIKVSVSEAFPHSDKEFENVAGEWFRQAKLRLTREQKKENSKENQ